MEKFDRNDYFGVTSSMKNEDSFSDVRGGSIKNVVDCTPHFQYQIRPQNRKGWEM